MAEEISRGLTTSSPVQLSNTMSGRAVAVLLKPLIDLHGEPRNWATAAPLYVKALADLPPELLASAVSHAIASNPFFPKPAELRGSVLDELRFHRRKQQDVPYLSPPDRPPVTPEDIVHVDDMVAQCLQILAGRRDEMKGDDDV